MHQNSSPYTNDDNDSNKENIPPTYPYLMPSNTRSAEWRALNRAPLQEISPSPDPNDIVVTTSPEPTPNLLQKPSSRELETVPSADYPMSTTMLPGVADLLMVIPADVTRRHHYLNLKHPKIATLLLKLPCPLPPYNNWMNSTPTKPLTSPSRKKLSMSHPLPPLTMQITPTDPSNTQSRWQKNFFPPWKPWMKPT